MSQSSILLHDLHAFGPLAYESNPYSCYVSLCVLQACVWASPPTCAGICLTLLLEAHVRLRSAFRCLVPCFYCVLVSMVISVVTAPTNLHYGSMMGPALDLRELAFRGSTAIQSRDPSVVYGMYLPTRATLPSYPQ